VKVLEPPVNSGVPKLPISTALPGLVENYW